MSYTDTYQECLDRIPDLVEEARASHREPVFGFTSNLDAILQWDVDKYNEILAEFLAEAPKEKEGNLIAGMEDFARISVSFLEQGLGGNFIITSREVCEYLCTHFGTVYALGGTCAQGAAAIHQMGFSVNVHISDCSRQVCELLSREGITSIKNGRKVPVTELISGKNPEYHIILQFDRGDVLRIGDREIPIPESNRLILFYDRMQQDFPMDDDFFAYWEETKEHPTSFAISGFDAIVDDGVMKEHIERVEVLLRRIREHSPETVIYFEGAFYMDFAMKDRILRSLGKYTDVIGMNEEELQSLMRHKKHEINLDNAEEVASALERMLELYQGSGVILHTKDYSLYYGDGCKGHDMKSGLTMGNIMSTTRARTGHYGNLEECKETLPLPISERGLAFAEELERIKTKRRVEIVPTRYLTHPSCTIGLGDTFVAGVQICFMAGGESWHIL